MAKNMGQTAAARWIPRQPSETAKQRHMRKAYYCMKKAYHQSVPIDPIAQPEIQSTELCQHFIVCLHYCWHNYSAHT